MKTVDREHLTSLMEREENRFISEHPKSLALYRRATASLVGGVPMNWMKKWPGAFPVFVEHARGAHFRDVDGHDYIDLCLGDTGAMTGHSPATAVRAINEQVNHGITFMLPTENAIWVAEELARRFGMPFWQFALTATDANRFTIRLARALTKRNKILVFNWCYHGSVDETFIILKDGVATARRGNLGPPVDPAVTTRVIEFNDVSALEIALGQGDVACVLAEPVMTNVGIVHPAAGFHDELRELTRRYGTLLVLDETHTICAGPGGYTRLHNLQPDFFVLGKPIASGVPGAAYGFTQEIANRVERMIRVEDCDTGGIGGTLAGNALSLAAMRASFEHVLTPAAFDRMISLGERFADGLAGAISASELPWHVARLGCRAEYMFRAAPPRNGSEAAAAADFQLERFMHLHALNRGVLLTPFHNMALMCPDTTEEDVDHHTSVFQQAVDELTVVAKSDGLRAHWG
jgi:glutamate-1-semialdehyde 2,1-aminomutase